MADTTEIAEAGIGGYCQRSQLCTCSMVQTLHRGTLPRHAVPPNAWTRVQQQMLEAAMRKHGQNWDIVSKEVVGMTREDCTHRYQLLCRLVRHKHAASASAVLPFSVQAIPGKALGCVAIRDIACGERLISEAPLISRDPDSPPLAELVASLSPQDNAVFFSLCQNSRRFGDVKTADGIFATNALPKHEYCRAHEAIFPTISRFNHACDASACFQWHRPLGRMTIHAARDISIGEEICICYGFPPGCLLREHRRARLADAFGFECECSTCCLRGEALRRSEELQVAIGDTMSIRTELCVWGSLPTLVCVDAARVLAKLDDRFQCINEETPAGHRRGVDVFLRSAVEFCEAAAARLIGLVHAAPPHQDALVMFGLPVQLTALRAAAVAYLRSARRWALAACDVTRDLAGDDSPAYAVWATALRDGFWTADEGGADDAPCRIGRLDFYREWVDAGLGAPGARIAGVILGGEAEGAGPMPALQWTVVGDSLQNGQPIVEW